MNDEKLDENIERILRFNCPDGCDGKGSYPEMSSDGEWEQGQCQWCFEFGMPARKAIIRWGNEQRIDELENTMPHTDGMRHYNTVRKRIVGLKSKIGEK